MIHICFNLDEKYLNPCKVLIREILATTKEDITFHFIGLTERDLGIKSKCIFYPNPDLSYFTDDNLSDYAYFSQAAMYRLLIPFLIKTDKALYMDIDMVVLKDIKKLWNKQIDLVGAVIDPCDIFHNERLSTGSKNYFNSGLILFNSKRIREEIKDYKERILKAQEDYVLRLKDQDIFNAVFNGHITSLGYEYNIDAHNLKEKGETKEVSKAKDKAFNDPTIVHCMGQGKWWTIDGIPFGDYWDKYAEELVPDRRKKCIMLKDMYIIRN